MMTERTKQGISNTLNPYELAAPLRRILGLQTKRNGLADASDQLIE